MRHYRQETVKITLLHLVTFPVGIGDLLFRTRQIDDRYPVPPAFLDACEMLANRYDSRISSIRPMIRFGSTVAFLENLLAGINADAVFVQRGIKEESPFKDSVQLMPLLNRSRFNIIETAPVSGLAPSSKSTVSDLLVVG